MKIKKMKQKMVGKFKDMVLGVMDIWIDEIIG